MVTISRFSDTFSLAGGLNLPKIIECIGSDGQYYKQLVKGKRAPLPASTVLGQLVSAFRSHARVIVAAAGSDDLRQDAVMQQMFLMVNILLRENPETRKRRLRVRSYKVCVACACVCVCVCVRTCVCVRADQAYLNCVRR